MRRQQANSKARNLLKAGSLGSDGGRGGTVELRPVPSSDQFPFRWFFARFLKKKKTNPALWGSSLVIGYFQLIYFSLIGCFYPWLSSSWDSFLWLSSSWNYPVPDRLLGCCPTLVCCSDILSCWLGCLYPRSDQTVNSYMFQLRSPSKYAPFYVTHLLRCSFHCSEQFLNSLSLMPFSASAIFCFTSSTSAKHFPLRTFFIWGNKKISLGVRLGE